MPFPEVYTTDPLGKRHNLSRTRHTRAILEEHPDMKGILTPRMSEDFKKSDIVKEATAPWWGTHVTSWADSIGYGVPTYLIRLFALTKAGTASRKVRGSVEVTKPIHDELIGHDARGGYFLTKIENIDVRKALDRVMYTMEIPDEDKERLKRVFPDMIEAGKVFKKIVKKYKEKYGLSDELEAFEALLKHPSPHVIVKDLADAEDLKKLHKLHVKLYNELPGVFLEDSGVRSLLRMKGVPEEEIRKIEEDALAELRGEKEALPPPPKKNYVGEFRGVPLEPGDKVEKYPGTDIDIIRKADGRIIVPPHKDLKEIPHVAGPDSPGIDLIGSRLFEMNIKKVEDLDRAIEQIQEYVDLVKEIHDRAAKKHSFDRLGKVATEKIKNAKGVVAKKLGEEFIWLFTDKEYRNGRPGYSHDHVVAETRAGIIAMLETIRLLQDIKSHPEKYGFGKRLSKKDLLEIKKIIMKKVGKKVYGYHHEKR